MFAYRQAKFEKGIREKTYFDLLPPDLKQKNVKFYRCHQWLILGALSEAYRNAVIRAINDPNHFESHSLENMRIDSQEEMAEFLLSYAHDNKFVRLNFWGCDFFTDVELSRLCPFIGRSVEREANFSVMNYAGWGENTPSE